MVINILTYAVNMCGHIHVCIKPSTQELVDFGKFKARLTLEMKPTKQDRN